MTTLDFEREQAALIGRISAGLAHDLNGPVGVILGFTELAAEIVAADDSGNGLQAAETRKIAGYLEMIEQSALRARGLTREIWEFARASVGTTGDLNLDEQLDFAARLAAPALRAEGVELPPQEDVVGAAEPPPAAVAGRLVVADRALLIQGLVGLMMEARAALPSGGKVEWEASTGPADWFHVKFTAVDWQGSSPAEWPVPDHSRECFELTGCGVEDGAGAGRAVVRLPAADA